MFPFSCPQFLKVWGPVTHELGLKAVPYEARHSGPSIDASRGLRTRAEIKARGRWALEKSVTRYEKRARLLQSFNRLGPGMQAYLLECERRLGDMLVRGGCPDDLALPLTRGRSPSLNKEDTLPIVTLVPVVSVRPRSVAVSALVGLTRSSLHVEM